MASIPWKIVAGSRDERSELLNTKYAGQSIPARFTCEGRAGNTRKCSGESTHCYAQRWRQPDLGVSRSLGVASLRPENDLHLDRLSCSWPSGGGQVGAAVGAGQGPAAGCFAITITAKQKGDVLQFLLA